MGSCGFLKFFCTSWISWAAEAARISLCPAVKASCGPSFPLMALVVFLQRRGRWFQLPCRDCPSCTCVSLAFSSLSGGATTQQILLCMTIKKHPRSFQGLSKTVIFSVIFFWHQGRGHDLLKNQINHPVMLTPHPNGPLQRHHHSVAAKRNDQGTPGISRWSWNVAKTQQDPENFHEKKWRLWFLLICHKISKKRFLRFW